MLYYTTLLSKTITPPHRDKETALDLWTIARKQTEIPKMYLQKDGTLDYVKAGKEWWIFIDWRDGLDKEASLYGVVIYGLQQTYDLAKMLGKEKEVADLPALIKSLTKVAKKKLYDSKQKVFVSGANRQVSYASQAWMILSKVATNSEGKAALTAAGKHKRCCAPWCSIFKSLCDRSDDPMRHGTGSKRKAHKLLGRYGEKRSRHILGSI